MLKLYNTLTRKKGAFRPISDNEVKMYACGPTVYYYAHIGNMKTYLSEDVIKRVLLHRGYKVTHVMNITDVGHLVGDGDVGEDKVVSSAKTEHKTARAIAEHYTRTFLEDSKLLNILPADITPKATDHIDDMIALISTLEGKGYTYKAENGVYYDTSKFKDYGELTGSTFKELNGQLKGGARVERATDLKNITDFAVWRFSKPEQNEMVWDTKWGRGFPGWHIECSAMSMKYLGSHFDLHFGGIDHIAIHHTNEIAQSDAAVGSRVVNCWMHMNFLTVDGMKMSKSLNNIYTIKELAAKHHSALAIRFFMISGHYRQQLNFTFEALASAENTLKGVYAFLARMADVNNKTENPDTVDFRKKVGGFKRAFFKELDDDINMPNAMASMHALMNEANSRLAGDKLSRKEASAVVRAMLEFDEILGLDFASSVKDRKSPLGKEAKALMKQREDARLSKDYAKADEIRKILKEKHHVVLEDTKDGLKWHTG